MSVTTILILFSILVEACSSEETQGYSPGYIPLTPETPRPGLAIPSTEVTTTTPYPTPPDCHPPALHTVDSGIHTDIEEHRWIFVPPGGRFFADMGLAVQFQGRKLEVSNPTGLYVDRDVKVGTVSPLGFATTDRSGKLTVLVGVYGFYCGESGGYVDMRGPFVVDTNPPTVTPTPRPRAQEGPRSSGS